MNTIRTVLILSSVSALVLAACQPQPALQPPQHEEHTAKPMKAPGPPGTPNMTSAFVYMAGTDGGTVVVPAGMYISAIEIMGAGTLTIAPSAQGQKSPCTGTYLDAGEQLVDAGKVADAQTFAEAGPCQTPGATITSVANSTYQLSVGNGLRGASNELADGTKLVFGSGSHYAVTLNAYGPQ